MAEQLIFNLPARAALGREDFFISPANQAAITGIEGWRDWPYGKMVLVGPKGAGKTHLAHVWAAMTGALIVSGPTPDLPQDPPQALVLDNADMIAGAAQEEALFHLHNAILARGGQILLTATREPSRWPIALPDLASRIAQAGLMRLGDPDDALLSALMVKLAADRQMALKPDLIAYAAIRMERSFAAVHALIEGLDQRSLRDKTRPSRKMIATLLDEQGQ